jgi:excisionase family DNA binding protein
MTKGTRTKRQILGITIYPLKEIAAMLNVTTMTMHNYIKQGKLPARKVGGAYYITEENLKEFISGSNFTDPVTKEKITDIKTDN